MEVGRSIVQDKDKRMVGDTTTLQGNMYTLAHFWRTKEMDME